MARPGLLHGLSDVRYTSTPSLYTISKGDWRCHLWMSRNCLVRVIDHAGVRVQAIIHSPTIVVIYNFKPTVYVRCDHQFRTQERIIDDWDKISGLMSYHTAISRPGKSL